jgi:hypothetical protein
MIIGLFTSFITYYAHMSKSNLKAADVRWTRLLASSVLPSNLRCETEKFFCCQGSEREHNTEGKETLLIKLECK